MKVAPSRFQTADWCLLTAVLATKNRAYGDQVATMAGAYRSSSRFHPDLSLAIANYYLQVGDDKHYVEWLQNVVQRSGYGEESSTRQACVDLGTKLLKQGLEADGRSLLWKAAQDGRAVGSDTYQKDLVSQMKARKK